MKIIILFGLVLLCGCATTYNPATGRNEYIFISTETEVNAGKGVQQEVLRQYELSNDAQLKRRVNDLGSRLAGVSDRQDLEYKFYVLEDKSFNAMALPGGFIYVNSGLAKLLNDDELAYVIGHEVSHVAAKHIIKKMQAGMTYQMILAVALVSAGDSSRSAAAANAVQGADTIYNLINLGYSRKDEYEADMIGVRYAHKAGFDPYASLSALEKIRQEEGPNWKVLGYFRSHPYADERIEALRKYIPELSAAGKGH